MNKKFVSIILLLVLVLSNTIVFAATGDIIHTGLNKVYRKDIDNALLVEDVLNPNVPKNKFFREIEVDGSVKFVNIVEEEDAHEKYIIDNMPKDLDLTDEEAVIKYILSQANELEKITKSIAKNFEDIGAGMTYDEYLAYHNVQILKTPDNYSIPEPGFREGSTKIAKLKLPDEAKKWRIQISDNKVPLMPKDTVLKNSMEYVSGRDIDIEVGKYLVLYAVDNENKIKAYANIKITESMINTPKELAPKIEVGEISEGKKYAGAVVISGLDELPEGATKWQVFVSPIPVERVYKIKMTDAIDYTLDEDVIIANENELHPILDSFKKYLVLLAVDDSDIVQAYNTFEINKNNLSKAPSILIENAHYKGPTPGDNDGTTKFTDLHFGLNPDENMKDATSWKVLVNNEPIPVPKLNAPGTVLLALEDNIEANIGDYLLLAAVDANDKIKGYKIFHLTENMVKGQAAPTLTKEVHYSEPTKGSTEGTTRINKLDLGGIESATKWMYKVGENLADPILNKIVSDSSDYTIGQNARANVGDDFLLLATDNDGKVKAFAKIKLDENMIKDPPPALLREDVNYVGPVKGNEQGTTKFEALSGSPSIGLNPNWRYMISDEEPEIPELNSTVDESKEFKAKDNIGENLMPGKYLMLLATDNNGYVKGYAIFRLNDANIKMPPATFLKEGEHYSKLEKGTGAGTTRIATLNPIGIEGVEQWRIKISKEKHNEPIELNAVIPQANIYGAGNNIRAEANDWLLLLATDYNGRVKGYTQIQLKEEDIRKPNATLLIPRTNYTEPEAGTVENSTRFEFLDSSTNVVGATEWRCKIGKSTFGTIELDSVIDDAIECKAGDNIVGVSDGDYLLLLATDGEGKIKGYREFRLTERNIRGGPARELNNDNYALEKGNKPGTTRFSKLVPLGMEGSIRWKYKLMDKELLENEKPYLNSIIENTNFVAMGQDIEVSEVENEYGYILLLATDYSGRTKGYAEIKIDPSIVKEHAPTWNVELEKGSVVDSVKITGTLPDGATNSKYVIGYREFPKPAVDEVLDSGTEYTLENDIPQVRIGEYIGIYAIDNESKIKAFNSFMITADDIKQGSAVITDATILEGSINNGGKKIVITLKDAEWAKDIKINGNKRNALYNGFKTTSETSELNKIIASLVADGSGAIDMEDSKLTISLPETKDYNISEDQEITLTVPAIAIEGATNPIEASGKIIVKPTVKATLSGDVVNSIVREDDIKAGDKTIVVKLEDGDWVGDINSKDNVDALIDGFSVVGSDNQPGTNWAKIANAIKANSNNIVRNSSKKLTITLPEVKDISFGVDKEIISLNISKALIQNAETDIVATPIFTLYPNVLQVEGKTTKDTIYLEAPDGKTPRVGMDIWEIKVTTGTLKNNVTDKDIIVSGLPRGLRANVNKVDTENNTISIKVSGTAAAKIENMEVKVKVKGSAVEEPNSVDSEDIELMLILSKDIMSELEKVNYDLRQDGNDLKIYLEYKGSESDKIEYSINSTDGINGTWDQASDNLLLGDAKPMKIWVREITQKGVKRQVGDLQYMDAPVDVRINSYDYSNGELEVVLKSNTTDMEYSINGSKTWQTLDNSTVILYKDSDLRIRKAVTLGVGGELPSHPTKKLNGIYLGDVELNVAEGIITGTTTNMEYSTDGEKYTQARNSETPINFVKGTTVWIRERGKGNEINNRLLGQVGQMEFSEDELKSIKYDISKREIGLESLPNLALRDLQYKIANDSWKDVDDGKNIEFKAGSLQFRKKGTDTNLPSMAIEKATIAPPEPAPELSYDDTNHTIEKIGTDEGGIYEYSIDSGISWNPGENATTFEAGHEVRIRIKATPSELASEIQTIKFTPNLNLSNVYLDAGKSMIMNTTAEMEYSLNSTTGLDGQWYKASSTSTSIPLKAGMVVHIREAKKPTNWRKLSDAPMKERTLNNIIIEERIDYSIIDNTIWIKTGKDLQWLQDAVDNLQYRNGGNTWINIPYTRLEQDKINILAYNVEFKPGKLEFRLKGDKDYLPSKPVEKAIIKANASAPNVKIDYIENKVISINGIDKSENWDIFEYSVDNGPWISGRYLKTEDLSGERILRVRNKATDGELPSQEAVINFTEKLPLEHVRLSTHVHPMELNGTTRQMEYGIWMGNDDNNYLYDGKWFNCNEDNTTLPEWLKKEDIYRLEIREKNNPKNLYEVYQRP